MMGAMTLTRDEINRRYYAKLKADPNRYKRIRRRHNAVRKQNGTWYKPKAVNTLDEENGPGVE